MSSRHKESLETRAAQMRQRQALKNGRREAPDADDATGFLDQHIKIGKLAELWDHSPDQVYRIFEQEGTAFNGATDRNGRKSLAVPVKEAERVYRSRLQSPRPTRAKRRPKC